MMTLWSWGGLVMRVRAERQQGGGSERKGGRQSHRREAGVGKVSAGDPDCVAGLWGEGR